MAAPFRPGSHWSLETGPYVQQIAKRIEMVFARKIRPDHGSRTLHVDKSWLAKRQEFLTVDRPPPGESAVAIVNEMRSIYVPAALAICQIAHCLFSISA